MAETEIRDRHRLVVVGGGFGGLQCVKSLRGAGLDITLIDRRNHHLFQPLLYQAATTILSPAEIAWPLRQMLRGREDVTTLMAEVSDVDVTVREIVLTDGARLGYDSLVLATGARHSYFGNDTWADHAPGLKTLEDATRIRRMILTAFERAERLPEGEARRAALTFAVIGAGPTGAELVGIIAELAHRILPRDFRRIDTRDARVMLIEAGDRVLSAFPDTLSDYAAGALAAQGVELRTGMAVTAIDETGITIGAERIACDTVLWAAGVQASRAGGWLGAEVDRAGRVHVAPDLSVPGHPEVFVIGDTAAVSDAAGTPVPGIAPAAKQMGAHVAKILQARLRGNDAPDPFRYAHAGSLATLGRSAAIADFGRLHLRGALAWWVWGIAHIFFLIGNRSRISVALSWLWSYAIRKNAARLITRPDR
ncbi:NAD(P)/FAD-dependent oxidoreductase [Jannaschia marina]|uniref:NAD(P)/FAD-dependent oxidoreductase n=1 Tax=Jannaschia marina TaxID=2741674 RepID=UPI001ABA3683|nr:NAD(P)/FAD-dependent oxidoreductase [Jannaschia marina]